MLVFAAAHVLIVALACAACTLCTFLFFSTNRSNAVAALWPPALIAVWLSPGAILLWQRSFWAVVPLLWITAKTARLAFPGRVLQPAPQEESWLTKPFSQLQRQPSILWLPFLTAIVFQAGLTAEVIHERLAAILMTGLAAGTLLWLRRRGAEGEQRSLSRKSTISRLLVAMTLAIVVSAAGMVSFLIFTQGFAENSVASVLLRELFWRRAAAHRARAQNGSEPPSPFGRGGGYRGVVLWPEGEPRPILLIPPPPKLSPEVFIAGKSRPVSFTFSGVYWFFKPPDVRPPEHSPRIRGNPAKMGLRSSDDYPLLMEAHQLFSSPVDLGCCSQIQVVIKNADPGSAPVFLELAVANTSMLGRSQSFGSQRVRSQPPVDAAGKTGMAEETLTFAVPAKPLVHDFDEMIFRFHRDYSRAGLSSRMAIEKLIFIPR